MSVRADAWRDSPFMRAARGIATRPVPIWIMRQAGRYLPAYRRLRARVPFLSLCRRADLAASVTVETAHFLKVDAAILFSDILLLLPPKGAAVSYAAEGGPRLARPLRGPADVVRLAPARPAENLGFVYEAVRAARRALDPRIPLIGFAGAPFTLASYLIEGGGSRDHLKTKTFMHRHPAAWRRLLAGLARDVAAHLTGQIAAGCQAVQIFDSWVGCLSPDDYRARVLPHTRAVFRALPPDVPAIHFGTGTAGLLEAMREAGGTVMGLDHRVEIGAARRRLRGTPVMGNLDPAILLADRRAALRQARRILDAAGRSPGHIFNLGHGVLPRTPVDNVRALVDCVHAHTAG